MSSYGACCVGQQVHIQQTSNTPSTAVCHAWLCFRGSDPQILSNEHLVAPFEVHQLRALVTVHQRSDKAYIGQIAPSRRQAPL